jgi:hypothetical protein
MSAFCNEESCTKVKNLLPIFEPPKETLDWLSSEGLDKNYNQMLDSCSWLNENLSEEVDNLRPSEVHKNSDGTYDATALGEAASQLLILGRRFFNIVLFI